MFRFYRCLKHKAASYLVHYVTSLGNTRSDEKRWKIERARNILETLMSDEIQPLITKGKVGLLICDGICRKDLKKSVE